MNNNHYLQIAFFFKIMEPCFFCYFAMPLNKKYLTSIMVVNFLKKFGITCMAGCHWNPIDLYQGLERWYLTQL